MISRALMAISVGALLLAGAATAQTVGEAGQGSALGSIEEIRKQIEQQWDGRPGQVVKGTIGVVGMAIALSAAKEAVSLEGALRGDGSVSASSSAASGPDSGSSTTTSSTTSTN